MLCRNNTIELRPEPPSFALNAGEMLIVAASDGIVFTTRAHNVTIEDLMEENTALRQQVAALNESCITKDDLAQEISLASRALLAETDRL